MDIKPKTDEQKYWYLKGYLECFIQDIADSFKISKEQAKLYVISILENSNNNK